MPTASRITALNPIEIARQVAKIALTTEAYPLIAHAHAIKCGLRLLNWSIPSGNGMPIKNASGAMSAIETIILIGSELARKRWKIGLSRIR